MDDPPHCHFRVLNVPLPEMAAIAYRKMMLLLHPDKRCVKSAALAGVENCDAAMFRVRESYEKVTALKELTAGCNVQLLGLKCAADLTGQVAVVEKYVHDSGRWRVKLRDGQVKDVKPTNLSMNFKLETGGRPAPASSYSMPASSPSAKVDFGKHRDKAYEDVRMHDPSYCSWVLRQDSQTCNDGLRRFQTYLQTASSGHSNTQ